jgi:hypothetical protein
VDLTLSLVGCDKPFEKGNELLACVTSDRLSKNRASLRIEGGVKRKCSMTNVLEPVPFCASRRQRKNRISSIQCLNRRLLVDAENRGMLGRIHVETDDVSGLGFEIWIVRRLVSLNAMGLKAVLLPRPSHHHVVNSKLLGEATASWRAYSPANRSSKKRFFHLLMNGAEQSTSRCTSR